MPFPNYYSLIIKHFDAIQSHITESIIKSKIKNDLMNIYVSSYSCVYYQ
jgi:hypothetical protein